MFKPVSPQDDLVRLEEGVLSFWQKQQIFAKSTALRRGGPEFVFYEGPPTANGKPGVHHVLARVFKDLFPRYKTMRGHHVLRRGGWDTHGLPVEIEVEKRLGFRSKRQIEEFGIDRFNELCRRSVFEYIQEWETLTDRIGFWVDLDDAYVTYTNDYIESVWWILKQLWDKSLLYQGSRVVPYCPRCGTPLSDHEVSLGYAEAEDPALIVRLPLVDRSGASLLIWTTTPWTLPGNVAVAVHPDEVYVTVERRLEDGTEERLILARDRLDQVLGKDQGRVLETYKGKRLRGRRYRPLYTFVTPDRPAHFVVLEDFVSVQEGTGLVHLAPAYGAEDMSASQNHNLPVLETVAPDGTFKPEVGPWRGVDVKQADPLIVQDLEGRGLLFRSGVYRHSYPFCWRCDTPLLYYARSTWYLRTTDRQELLVALNREINWHPEHIMEGRFGNWLENNVDWALGRERYWGTPLPIWSCSACSRQECVGSVAELSSLARRDLRNLELHRPHVDEVAWPCPDCDGEMQRVQELADVWFDSGAMPVAQWHFPFEHEQEFESQFPADFICEAVDQTRGWFYSLHAISTLLFERVAFKNAISLGLILDAEGRKMSKSRGNVVDPWMVLDRHGADAFRWALYSASPPGQERRFSIDMVGEAVRSFLLPLWNVYSFFVTYANLDGWLPARGGDITGAAGEPLDRWILSELEVLVESVTGALESYDPYRATRFLQEYLDLLSRWYLRRSRQRFWKGGTGEDKQAAYGSLYRVLVTLSKLLAPFLPFLTEALYRNLAAAAHPEAPESVHLADWPQAEAGRIDHDLNRDMRLVMRLASIGHAARNSAGIRVRQPVAQAYILIGQADEAHVIARYAPLLEEELNVKRVEPLETSEEIVFYQLNPLPKQLGQKYQARFPAVREAILSLDAGDAARDLLAGSSLFVELQGERMEILPEEVEVRAIPRSGLAMATEGPYLVALTTEISLALLQEGMAREFVRHIQELRKRTGFEVADRIRLYYRAPAEVAAAVEAYRAYIGEQTLAVELQAGHPEELAHQVAFEIGGDQISVGIARA